MESLKIFGSGRSQAVRVSKDFRFDASELGTRRHGSAVFLEPVAHDRAWLEALASKPDADFVAGTREQPKDQARPAVQKLLR